MAARQFWRGLLDADNPMGIYKKESKIPSRRWSGVMEQSPSSYKIKGITISWPGLSFQHWLPLDIWKFLLVFLPRMIYP
jgi:hypothetical protein